MKTEAGSQRKALSPPLSRKSHGIKFSPFPKCLTDPAGEKLAAQSGGKYVAGQRTQGTAHMHLLLG